MTVTEAFATFKTNLELPDKLQDQASAAQQEVRSNIGKYLFIDESFLSGSYPRHAKIDPLKDIDIILVRNTAAVGLATDGSGVQPAQALHDLRSATKQAYPNATVTQQARSVNVQIPGITFGFDLVPAWRRNPDGFWIPDTDTNTWLPTNPQYHATLMTDCNKMREGKLKPLVKMAKHWSRQNYDLFRSFHLELVSLSLGTTYTLGNAQGNIAGFLAHLPEFVGVTRMDPAYSASRVDKQLSPEELTKLRLRIGSDASRARTALEQEDRNDHSEAIANWKQIFVTGFPN